MGSPRHGTRPRRLHGAVRRRRRMRTRTDDLPRRRHFLTSKRVSGVLLTLLVLGAAFVAINLHRRGHTTGDDWALYIRMAKSVFEGNIADVISDNRFLFDHSTAVTPPIYPWGWPLLLSPFVRVWGIDFDRLKLVEVAVLCAWLVLYHGIVRRRAGRIVAFALTAVFATSYAYLVYTDQLLTEYPHMFAVAVVIWWLDRVMDRSRLTSATTRDLVILGLLAVAAYNVRREGLMLLFAIAGAQLVDLVGERSAGQSGARRVPRDSVEGPAHAPSDVRRRRRDLPVVVALDTGSRQWEQSAVHRHPAVEPRQPADRHSPAAVSGAPRQPARFARATGVRTLDDRAGRCRRRRRVHQSTTAQRPIGRARVDDDARHRDAPADGGPLLHADHSAHRLLRGDAAVDGGGVARSPDRSPAAAPDRPSCRRRPRRGPVPLAGRLPCHGPAAAG